MLLTLKLLFVAIVYFKYGTSKFYCDAIYRKLLTTRSVPIIYGCHVTSLSSLKLALKFTETTKVFQSSR